MSTGYLILVMLEITLFAEIGLLCETVVSSYDVLTFLAYYFLFQIDFTLNFCSWTLVNENWMR